MENNAFCELFKILREADLFGEGPNPINMNIPINIEEEESLRSAIEEGAAYLPGLYYDSYVSPLLRNLKWVKKKVSGPSLETLVGAVNDHGEKSYFKDKHQAEKEILKPLQGFLAVISNLYRSFLEPEPSAKGFLPTPASIIPPLATFRPKLYLIKKEYGPFTLPINEVDRLCGGKVAVVSLPSCYRHHPALCWGAIAHEAGGHDVLHAYPGLLLELQRGVRNLFYNGPDPNGIDLESDEQFLGLLWQYWTEEAASDVCAVLNLGPAYGLGIAVYFSAFNERIGRGDKEKGKEPRLTVSWPPSKTKIDYVDYHPTDILKLYVVIGAIEALPLSLPIKNEYIQKIQDCINLSLEADANNKEMNQFVKISGSFSFKPGKLVKINSNKPRTILRTTMENHARRVGKYIASEPMRALNGNSLQDLETWDMADEALAEKIKDNLASIQPINPFMSYLGDDSQLLAGSLLTLFNDPSKENYERVNIWLADALMVSWLYDPIWSSPKWHPLVGGPPRNLPDIEEIMKKYQPEI